LIPSRSAKPIKPVAPTQTDQRQCNHLNAALFFEPAHYGNTGGIIRAVVSSQPSMRLAFCTACPEEPFVKLSKAANTINPTRDPIFNDANMAKVGSPDMARAGMGAHGKQPHKRLSLHRPPPGRYKSHPLRLGHRLSPKYPGWLAANAG
jgi:hypothetical protein